MLRPFVIYLTKYLLHAKTRQKLLFLASVGLALSSFSMLVLQSTMGGLQNNLIKRSKAVIGHASVEFSPMAEDRVEKLEELIADFRGVYITEYEIELLARHGKFMAPVIAHGLKLEDKRPKFLSKKAISRGGVFSYSLASRLGTTPSSDIKLISPQYTDYFLGDIPRILTVPVGEAIDLKISEEGVYHIWLSDRRVQSLVRAKEYNKIRIYNDIDFEGLEKAIVKDFGQDFQLYTWEEQNEGLVYALQMESRVMTFLFSAMAFLVSLAITSGLMIFWGKLEVDLTSFWILGGSESQMKKGSFIFVLGLSIASTLFGLFLALAFLWVLDQYGGNIFPDVFVDRKIPVLVRPWALFTSFMVPFTLSTAFSCLTLFNFNNRDDRLSLIRSVG